MEAYFNGVKLTNAKINLSTSKEGNLRIYITDAANKVEELTREIESLKFDKQMLEINSISQSTRIAELKTVNEILQDIIVNLRTTGVEE